MTINSGYLIVESGGNLTITGSFAVGGLTIINRGTLTINGNLTLQGTVSAIWNDLTTSYFSISGALVVNNASTIVNRGIFTVSGSLTLQGTGNTVCLQDNSIFNVSTLTNNVTNSFTYAGSGSQACLSISGTASLNNALTASSKISACYSSSTHTTGWGSAQVTYGCSSCATILALTISDLTAARQGSSIALQWTTRGVLHNGDIFYVERSTDGSHFYAFTSVEAKDDRSSYSAADNLLTAPEQYYRVKTVTSAGITVYSTIALAATGIAAASPFTIYPNPVGPNSALYIRLTADAATGIAHLYLLDAAGRTVRIKNNPLTPGANLLSWDLQSLRPGIYFLKIVYADGKDLHSTVTVLDGY
jgi:hypothetical protein